MSVLFLICLGQKNLKKYKNNRAFTLIELILGLAIASIVILAIYPILNISSKAYIWGDSQDEVLLNARYAMEYIKRDIRSSDKIIDIKKIRIENDPCSKIFRNNIGFVFMKEGSVEDKYSTYYFKNNKLIYVATSRGVAKYPPITAFCGHNLIADHIISTENTKIDWEKKIITISLEVANEDEVGLKLENQIKIRCPVDY